MSEPTLVVSSLTPAQHEQLTANTNSKLADSVRKHIAAGWLFLVLPSGWTFTWSRPSVFNIFQPRNTISIHLITPRGRNAEITVGAKAGIQALALATEL